MKQTRYLKICTNQLDGIDKDTYIVLGMQKKYRKYKVQLNKRLRKQKYNTKIHWYF